MRVFMGLMILYGTVRLAGGQFFTEGIYVCLSIPEDYPSNITSLLLTKTPKEITTSMFTSPNLKSVKRLTLPLNGIENVQAGAFRIFEKLTSFVLHGSYLKTISPAWFHESVPLEALNVANNSIDKIGPEMLAGLSSLQTLDFSSNRISKIRGGSFSDLAKLFFLDLSSNNLSYLPKDVLKPLQNVSFKLGNNPWNCSCPYKDFAVFLQDLRNSSRLMDPEKVVCHSPPTLNRTSVWNVTFDNCSSTNTEIPPTAVAQTIIGTALMVILAMVLFPLLLFLIWKKKQENKQVQPNKDGMDSRISSDTGRWTVMGAKISLKGVLFNKEHARGRCRTRNVLKMGRSKSASAILLKSDFFQSNTSQLNLQLNTRLHHGKNEKQQGCQKQDFTDKTVSFILGNIDSHKMDLCYYNNLDSCQGKSLSAANSPVMTGETAQDICPGFYSWHDSSHRWATAVLSTEAQSNLPIPDSNLDSLGPLVYLSVNTKPKEPVAISSTNQVVAQKSIPLKLRPLRRTYTWPKARVQSDQDTNSSYELFLKTLHISPKPSSKTVKNRQSNIDQNQNCGPQADCSHLDMFNILAEQAELKEESRLYNISTQVGNPSKEKKEESKSQGGVCQHVSSTRRAYKSSSPYSGRQKRHVASSERASRREELNSRDSAERNNQRMTPDDDTLLENNEYNFIDLLHEVVENHGRWTRDRWRQNHQQRLPQRSSPMSLKE